jgi:hypothetical protein
MSRRDVVFWIGSLGLNSYSGDVAGSSSIVWGLGRVIDVNLYGRRTVVFSEIYLYFCYFFIVSITDVPVTGVYSSELLVLSILA